MEVRRVRRHTLYSLTAVARISSKGLASGLGTLRQVPCAVPSKPHCERAAPLTRGSSSPWVLARKPFGQVEYGGAC